MNNTGGKQLGFCKSDQLGRMLHACAARESESERERAGEREGGAQLRESSPACVVYVRSSPRCFVR